MRIDLACSLGILALFAGAGAAYGVHVSRAGAARFARVDKAGASALLSKGAMEAGYWSLQPVGRALIALGLTANGVTLISLGLGLSAAVALAFGHFGVGAALTAAATLGDALDGIVARQTGTASDAGEVFDAAVDRYQEFFFLGGLAVYFRADEVALGLTLLAVLGSFMVSYGTAKAEALGVPSPRGAMRRVERAVYLGGGVVFVPVAAAFAARFGLPAWVPNMPILLALALVGGVGNVSAVRRLHAIARAVADRDGAASGKREPARPAAPSHPEAGVPEDAVHDGVTPLRSSMPTLDPSCAPRPGSLLFAHLGRHQIASVISTAVDFGTMVLAVELLRLSPVAGTVAGASFGAVTNFQLGRHFTFGARHDHVGLQAVRYALVSAASAGLNALGEYGLHTRLGVQYLWARALVAVAVSLLWNFPLQRYFVFRSGRRGGLPRDAERGAAARPAPPAPGSEDPR